MDGRQLPLCIYQATCVGEQLRGTEKLREEAAGLQVSFRKSVSSLPEATSYHSRRIGASNGNTRDGLRLFSRGHEEKLYETGDSRPVFENCCDYYYNTASVYLPNCVL